jgi:LacI family transcriptional regulator
MRKALKKGKSCTAVFAFSDETAIGAISALAENGLRVPEDVSVLGFDGIAISQKIVPKLTTIYQPIDKMVEWTLNTLCSADERAQVENMEYTLPYKLLERGTCIRWEEKS